MDNVVREQMMLGNVSEEEFNFLMNHTWSTSTQSYARVFVNDEDC
jgi:hypothetical protein